MRSILILIALISTLKAHELPKADPMPNGCLTGWTLSDYGRGCHRTKTAAAIVDYGQCLDESKDVDQLDECERIFKSKVTIKPR